MLNLFRGCIGYQEDAGFTSIMKPYINPVTVLATAAFVGESLLERSVLQPTGAVALACLATSAYQNADAKRFINFCNGTVEQDISLEQVKIFCKYNAMYASILLMLILVPLNFFRIYLYQFPVAQKVVKTLACTDFAIYYLIKLYQIMKPVYNYLYECCHERTSNTFSPDTV